MDHMGAYTFLLDSGSAALNVPVKVYRGTAEWKRDAIFLKDVYNPFVQANADLVEEQIIDPAVERRRTIEIEPDVSAHLYVAKGKDVYNSLMMLLEYHDARPCGISGPAKPPARPHAGRVGPAGPRWRTSAVRPHLNAPLTRRFRLLSGCNALK